jgi:hypothetical protein
MTSVRPFRVVIAAHPIPPRWEVPGAEVEVFAESEREARRQAVRSAHLDAGVPPLRSLLRLSWEHVTATAAPYQAHRDERLRT